MNNNCSIENQIKYVCNCEYEYFLNKANVVGVGLGYKLKNGFYTNQLCIKVLVSKKISDNELNPQDSIPSVYKGISTDVISTGTFKTNSLTSKIRPVVGGYVIGNNFDKEFSGTIGCLVTDVHNYYVLSCNHVLANNNSAPLGTKILQPSFDFKGDLRDTIAILSKFVPIKFIKGTKVPVNYADCAIAKVTDKFLISSKIALVGEMEGMSFPRLNQEVKKVGCTTGLTTGTVNTVNATVQIECSGVEKEAIFKEQIITTKMSTEGDSGAILLDKSNKALGLVMSSTDTHSTSNAIAYVLRELKVHLVTNSSVSN
ncbi:trypsin-like serine protease [Clostridium botulinum]|nr:trypsin-like serine protease [Clostridium botulinum]NFL02571.1 trypsin-like serine protease [Clostridium botulinum]